MSRQEGVIDSYIAGLGLPAINPKSDTNKPSCLQGVDLQLLWESHIDTR